MSIRDYSVIVNPEDWSGSVEDLARRLVPIVGQPSSQLVKRFTNGPMTVESDLTLQSAQALADRLETLGVTSRIQSENEEESIDVDDFEWDAADFDLDSMFSEVENLPGDSSAVFDEEVNPRQTQMGFSTAFAHDMARKPKAPELDAPKKEPSQPSGWGDIFPELEKPAEEQPETEQPKVTPTSERVATSEIVTAPPAKQPEARPKVDPAKPTPPSLDELAGNGSVPKHGTELARIKPVKRLVEIPKPKAETTPAPAAPIEAAPTIEPPPPVATRPVAPRPIAPQNPSMSAAAFMDELVGNEQSSLGPYAPVGFDDG